MVEEELQDRNNHLEEEILELTRKNEQIETLREQERQAYESAMAKMEAELLERNNHLEKEIQELTRKNEHIEHRREQERQGYESIRNMMVEKIRDLVAQLDYAQISVQERDNEILRLRQG